MNHITKTSVVTHTLNITWNTVDTEDPEVIDYLLDAEDDIITTAAFVYHMEASFGDEFKTHLFVYMLAEFDEDNKRWYPVYEVVEDSNHSSGALVSSVDVTVRAGRVII